MLHTIMLWNVEDWNRNVVLQNALIIIHNREIIRNNRITMHHTNITMRQQGHLYHNRNNIIVCRTAYWHLNYVPNNVPYFLTCNTCHVRSSFNTGRWRAHAKKHFFWCMEDFFWCIQTYNVALNDYKGVYLIFTDTELNI